jgi:pimeloyl-ACP methyl ester carboxylesterase
MPGLYSLIPRTQDLVTTTPIDTIDQEKRRLLGSMAMAIAAAGAASLFPAYPARGATNDSIRPFRINVPQEDLIQLRQRVLATRWPDPETVSDQSQGVQLAKVQELVRHWGSDYDWRKIEAKLNGVPQFMTSIDGVDIHFMHVRSRHPNALPLIITHGWPGSVIELLKVIDPLTDPTSHGGRSEDAFDVIIPSIPGFGFSGKPTGTGWDVDHVAQAWAELMKQLGYSRYVAQGGDWGAPITSAMARQKPASLLGIHVNLPATVPVDVQMALNKGEPAPDGLSEAEKAAFESISEFSKKRRGYAIIMGARPQTVGYGLTDSPAGLAAWMYDYNDAEPHRLLSKNEMLDDITLYWLTNTAASSARLYWENKSPLLSAAAQKTAEISIPVGVTVFPGDIYRAPKSWTQRAYRNLVYFNEAEKGGHFAAWEEPELFSAELRAAFKSLRRAE